MPKKCIVPNCNQFVFSHSYCRTHVGIYYQNKNQNKPIKQFNYIKPISIKRQALLARYEVLKELKKTSLILTNNWHCIFTGKSFGKDDNPAWHHMLGRKGKLDDIPLLIHPTYLWPCYDEPHQQWHDLPIDKLEQLEWWPDFQLRMFVEYPKVYQLIQNKKEKK